MTSRGPFQPQPFCDSVEEDIAKYTHLLTFFKTHQLFTFCKVGELWKNQTQNGY